MIKNIISFLVISILFLACTPNDSGGIAESSNIPETVLDYPSLIEKAHSKEKFLANDAISFDFLLIFGGNERINGSMTLATNSSRGVLNKGNDDKMIFEGGKVFYAPTIADSSKVRFDAYTWSYFFLFPFKLNDGGTVWNDYENDSLNDELFDAQKLTFESGTGDAPDDWYITYANTKTNLLHAAAYIVTYSKDKSQAEEDPHAIVYKDYKEVDGVKLAHSWEFWGWRETNGLTEQLGEATLSNFKFHEAKDVDFSVPSDYIEI